MNEKLTTSIIILKELNAELKEITRIALVCYRRFANKPSDDNRSIMNCVYAFLVIRATAFYDELDRQFIKIYKVTDASPLDGAIDHYIRIMEQHDIKQLRHFLAHNRDEITKCNYEYITIERINGLRTMNSPASFEAFEIASSRVVSLLDSVHDKKGISN